MSLRSGSGALCSKEPLSLSFSGSGFLAVYQLGVSQCFRDLAPMLLQGAPHIYGASAGSLVAAAVACGSNLERVRDEIVRFAETHVLASLLPPTNVFKWIEYVLRRLLPKNAHLLATGRLFVSMTRIPDGRNVLVSEFHSREDVIQALLCSCFLPLYCGIQPPCYKGVYYIDGGFTDILPVPGSSRTLTVSPFAGEVDICPRDPNAGGYAVVLSGLVFHFSLPNCTRMTKALFPPAPSVLSKAYENGYQDALFFLQNSELIEFQPWQNIGLKSLWSGNERDSVVQLAEEEEEEDEKEDLESPNPSTEECAWEPQRNVDPGKQAPTFSLLLWLQEALLCNLLKHVGLIYHDVFHMRFISYLLLPYTLPIYTSFLFSYRLFQFLRLLSEMAFWQDVKQVSLFITNIIMSSLRKNMEHWFFPSFLLSPGQKILAMYDGPTEIEPAHLLSTLQFHLSSHSDKPQTEPPVSRMLLSLELEVDRRTRAPALVCGPNTEN
ncbi:patatin-like phospholipase domain-containing protein 2 [Scleropages formosus]|uniref:patatin-like phospholipase domain-containing protein 2 n=1 Tax=Scleropages formosus TaxID=113540 RepID=UPI000878910F|nr:patatin-like phospholipase domain-containing protein 2 [Scleropages formosus]